jgi:hypothetical protein
MAYGDDRPSTNQRCWALATATVAIFVIAYGWLVAGMMASAPNSRLIISTGILMVIVIVNGTLLFGRPRSPSNWLRIFGLVSLGVMIAPFIIMVLDPYGR